jgi:hypothetical protein
MNTPTHETVAQRAQEIWQSYGRPEGRDTEIWLEAERQLAGGSESATHSNSDTHQNGRRETESASIRQIRAETAAESMVENHISPAISEEKAIKAAVQKRDARAPIQPHKTAPKSKPAETGKPLWKKPHSS